MKQTIHIIGAGLAGSAAAWAAANNGAFVKLYEMRQSQNLTHAHKTDKCAELVCSNSFRGGDINTATGLLHAEMRMLGSLIIEIADKHKLPAGSALAVDREEFASEVQQALTSHPNIEIIRGEITSLQQFGEEQVIIASGPLTSDKLTQAILALTGKEQLSFFDAIAPIIYTDSIDFDICWRQSRYDKTGPGGTGKDYINCPLSEQQYNDFIDALIAADRTDFKEWEKNTPYFNGCLPIEVMAERGRDTPRFGPMKPVGLTNPHSDVQPHAVVQLRQDNKLGTLYNIVGFQTKIKYGQQKEVLQMIPGLQNAEFARLGGLHRNSFINSPLLLDSELRLHTHPNIRFAGQITGVEGYIESAATGWLAGSFATRDLLPPPAETAHGALLRHITGDANSETFQPMNINFGLVPPLDLKLRKKQRYEAYSKRAVDHLTIWHKEHIGS